MPHMPEPDAAQARPCRFRVEDSPIFNGLYVGPLGGEFDHVLVDEATMMALGQWISDQGDRWEPEEPRDDGLYDLGD
jgi:hypothetical protein